MGANRAEGEIVMNELINDEQKTKPQGNAGRRRFMRGVGVAVPVSLTVSARSVMACTCSTVSAHASIALANSHNATGDVNQHCAGLSPSAWSAVSSYTGKTTKLSAVFSPCTTTVGNLQMKDAISNSDLFVKDIATAYLNLLNNKVVGFYDLPKLQAMWKGRTSGFLPISGASTPVWYESEIEKYLEDTWN
jgi:hypothetical protein